MTKPPRYVKCETKGCHSRNATKCYRLNANLQPTYARLCQPCCTKLRYTRVDHTRGPYAGSGRTPAE